MLDVAMIIAGADNKPPPGAMENRYELGAPLGVTTPKEYLSDPSISNVNTGIFPLALRLDSSSKLLGEGVPIPTNPVLLNVFPPFLLGSAQGEPGFGCIVMVAFGSFGSTTLNSEALIPPATNSELMSAGPNTFPLAIPIPTLPDAVINNAAVGVLAGEINSKFAVLAGGAITVNNAMGVVVPIAIDPLTANCAAPGSATPIPIFPDVVTTIIGIPLMPVLLKIYSLARGLTTVSAAPAVSVVPIPTPPLARIKN